MKKIFALMIVTAFAFGCKNVNENKSSEPENNSAVTEQTEVQPEVKTIDTLALFDYINGRLMDLSGEQLWSKDIFTPDYYEACQKLCEFSDGDALWALGSIQVVQSVSLTDMSEFKIQDYAHITAEAALNCKDMGDNMEGTEFRTLKLILRDGNWLIDDVNNYKESYLEAIKEHEASTK
ncbi:MAG: hypothetical protein IJK74_07595 [Bacteroidales bacterium]|nr:hypothetical protein [Bacteroidales bacterium]